MSRRRGNRNDADGGYEGTELPRNRQRRQYQDDHEDPPYDDNDDNGSIPGDDYAHEDQD